MKEKSSIWKRSDPRWQKVEFEIMKRDKWTCKMCGDKTTTLYVMRMDNDYNIKSWECDKDYLATLCGNCIDKMNYDVQANFQFDDGYFHEFEDDEERIKVSFIAKKKLCKLFIDDPDKHYTTGFWLNEQQIDKIIDVLTMTKRV